MIALVLKRHAVKVLQQE